MTHASAIPPKLRILLTKAQEIILTELYNNAIALNAETDKALHGVKPANFNGRIIAVHICNLRKLLKPLGITIKTIWGRGYMLTDESRAIIASMTREAA